MWTSLPKGLATILAGTALAACGGKQPAASRKPIEALDEAAQPLRLATELVQLGGGHVRATATFHVDSARAPASGGTKPASPTTVTTTTELWLDKRGNYRFIETNDQDGGREIVYAGGQIAVALRYGRMIRRTAEDSETARYLAEALGAPWAAWELVRRQVEVEGAAGNYRFRLRDKRSELPAAGFAPAEGLRAWRDTVVVKSLDGDAVLSPDRRTLLAFGCKAAYQAVRDGTDIEGSLVVSMAVDRIGLTVDVALPASQTLQTRQRTVLEEKALLGGINAAASGAAKKALPASNGGSVQ